MFDSSVCEINFEYVLSDYEILHNCFRSLEIQIYLEFYDTDFASIMKEYYFQILKV